MPINAGLLLVDGLAGSFRHSHVRHLRHDCSPAAWNGTRQASVAGDVSVLQQPLQLSEQIKYLKQALTCPLGGKRGNLLPFSSITLLSE